MGRSSKQEGEEAPAPDPFQSRMEDQCRHVARYRMEVMRTQGRALSEDEAALEWIERYAEAFDRTNSTL